MSEQLQRFVSFIDQKPPEAPKPEELEEGEEPKPVKLPHQRLIDAREVVTATNNAGSYGYNSSYCSVTLQSGRLTEEVQVYEPYEQVVSKIQEALR